MHSRETKVSPLSDYYVYVPSALARELYLYPLHIGYYIYEPEYQLRRSRFDSFFIMYIVQGTVDIISDNKRSRAKEGDFVFLNCYHPHQYGSSCKLEISWLHFDGTLAPAYYKAIVSQYGNVLTLKNSAELSYTLNKIFNLFKTASPIQESVISGYITDLLNNILKSAANLSVQPKIIEDSIAYISEHFQEQISLNHLAKIANLSSSHFTRIFTRETGFTPHQYLINTRIEAAKFMLKSSEMSVKDISFSTGFHSESGFCAAFKKWVGVTPTQYRGDAANQA